MTRKSCPAWCNRLKTVYYNVRIYVHVRRTAKPRQPCFDPDSGTPTKNHMQRNLV